MHHCRIYQLDLFLCQALQNGAMVNESSVVEDKVKKKKRILVMGLVTKARVDNIV